MSKVFVSGLVILTLLSLAWMTLAAQPALQVTAKISSPAENSVVRGTVPIVGSAVDPDFWKFEMYFGPEPNPGDQWTFIGSVHERPVTDGLLETWHTNSVADGTYSLRLRVVNRTGNYHDVHMRGIRVANAVPTETPVPVATPTPEATATFTPAATPTFALPTSDLAQPTPTPTLARPNRSGLPDVFDLSAWRRSLCLGAEVMAGFLVLLGVVQALRRRY
jgi:hypothetical protein